MAIIEGTGIKAAGTEAQKKAVQQKKEVKTAGIKTFLQRKVNEQLNKMTEEGKTPFGTRIGGSAVGEEGLGSFVNPKEVSMKKTNFFSPGGGAFDERNNVQLASSDLSNLKVGSDTDTDTSTFGASFTKQADANIADASVYQKKEDNIYRSTDNVYDSVKFPKIEQDTGYGASIEKSLSELSDTSKSIYGIDEKTKEYGVPMSKEEKKATTAYELTNLKFPFKDDRYKFSDTNYDKIQSDYDKYKDLRDRRQVRKEGEEAVTKFRKDYMKDFYDADYAIKMKRYNPDGTESELNKYNLTRDEYLKRLKTDLRDYNEITAMYGEGVNNAMDRYGNLMTSKEKREIEQKIDNEEQERIRLSKLKAKKDYEESQKNVFQKAGDLLGGITNKVLGIQPAGAAESPLSRTVPSGSFGISQEGRDQAAINRGVAAAAKTGIPSGADLKAGSFGISKEGRDQAAINRGIKAAEATGIPSGDALKAGSFGISEKGKQEAAKNKAMAKAKAQAATKKSTVSTTTKQGKQRTKAQMAAAKRKASGKSISQTKAANKASMKKAAAARNASFQARKKAGKLSKSERTASGQRAANKAKAKARAQAAAKKRRAKKKKSKKK